jgi:hypothetical protein
MPATVSSSVEAVLRDVGAVAPVGVEVVDSIECDPGHAAKLEQVRSEIAAAGP